MIVIWYLYLLSLIFLWYENKNIVIAASKRAPIYRIPFLRHTFRILRMCLQYGSVISIFYYHNIFYAILAFSISYLIGFVTYKMYFGREMDSNISKFQRLIKRTPKGKALSDATVSDMAKQRAEDLVIRIVKG